MNGVLVIDKPAGKTSHDIVSMVRNAAGTRRVGHTGTLDPLATGVLVICIGNATRAAGMLTSEDKKYRAKLELGKRTDTLDIDGRILEELPVAVTEDEIRACVTRFIGETEQLPPMYSAVKQNGKKLYELARAGVEVERKPRGIMIYSIEICGVSLPFVTIDVHCSKGTYIRSLCSDIGDALGCGAVMTELRRTAAGNFGIDKAVTIDDFTALEDKSSVLIPTDSLFEGFGSVYLNEKQERSVVNGVRMTWRGGTEGEIYRVYSRDGRFLCLSKLEDSRLRLVKAFWT